MGYRSGLIVASLLVAIGVAAAATAASASLPEHECRSAFEEWCATHNKEYATAEEEEYRFGVFRRNFELVHANNRDPTRQYSLAANKFADLTVSE
jgi:hypothetical protein